MNDLLFVSTVALISYLIGSIPFGLIIGKLHGVDIREHGSRNVGSTNVTRVLGRPWGVLCFVLDFCKGLLTVLAIKALAPDNDLAVVTAVAASFSGHVWSVFLKFKGGKGVATGAGAMAAISPLGVLASIALWMILFMATRYVSLASVIATAFLPFAAFLAWKFGFEFQTFTTITLLAVICSMSILRHKSNIVRLVRGEENRFERKRKG